MGRGQLRADLGLASAKRLYAPAESLDEILGVALLLEDDAALLSRDPGDGKTLTWFLLRYPSSKRTGNV